MSDYRLQIIHKSTGQVARWHAGGDIEVDLVDKLCDRLKSRSVSLLRSPVPTTIEAVKKLFLPSIGVLTSDAVVIEIVREEFAAMLHELKSKI